MGLGGDQPKGNVYSKDEFNSVPIFPEYEERAHSAWLGFKEPERPERPYPFLSLVGGESAPSPGMVYYLIAYRDAERTQEIPIEEALQDFAIRFNCDGFDYIPYYNANRTFIGIEVNRVYVPVGCGGVIQQLSFLIERVQKHVKYYEMRSVTATMNSVFDKVILELDRFDAVKSIFSQLTDIRRLEDINAFKD